MSHLLAVPDYDHFGVWNANVKMVVFVSDLLAIV